jgi:organic hydroperoxide reductase OsmC/OhrA
MGVRLKTWAFYTRLRWEQDGRGMLDAPGIPALGFATPPEFDGEGGRWTPEQMLVGAAEACTLLTFLAMARREGVNLVGYKSHARGTLSAAEDGALRFTDISIEPRIEVASEEDVEKTRAILARLPGRCFIGASLKSEPRIDAVVLAAGR